MKTTTILIFLLSTLLTACVTTEQVKEGTEISVNAYIVNEAVDSVQSSLGQYSVNQETIKQLDELQVDISDALKGGDAILKIDGFYQRGVEIYNVLNAEAMERHDELTPAQQNMLRVLNVAIINLDTKIKAFKENENNKEIVESVESMVDLIGTAKAVLSIYKVGVLL